MVSSADPHPVPKPDLTVPSRARRSLSVLGGLLLLLVVALVAWVVFAPDPPDSGCGPRGPISPPPAPQTGGGDTGVLANNGSAPQRQRLIDENAAYEAALSGFRGRLIDHLRRPAADRAVRFYRIDPELLQNPGLFTQGDDELAPRLQIHTGRTDAAGEFLITGAWPHSVYILEADADGDDRLEMPVDRSPAPGEIIDLGDIQLRQLGVITGRVVTEDGRPLPDVTVRAADIPGSILDLAPLERFDPEGALIVREGSRPAVVEMPRFVKRVYDLVMRPRTVTDAQGRFRLAGVQPADNAVAFNVRGYVPEVKRAVRVHPGETKDIGTVRLRSGEEAFVRVRDSDDKPVAGAEVLVAPTTVLFRVDFALRAGRTDDKGELAVAGLPAGRVTVAARRDRNQPWVIVEPTPVSRDVVVRVPGAHHLDLTLRSALGRELTNPRFKLLPSPDEGMPLDAGAMGFVKWLDVQRRVRRLEDSRYRIDDLIPGKYTLAVTADGHAAGKVHFRIDKDATAELELAASTEFDVLVTDHAGKPVSRARIYMRCNKRDAGPRMLEMPVVAGETDRSGRLHVPHGEAGTFRISASHPAFGFAHREFVLPVREPVVLQMAAPGQLSGALTERGRPPVPGKWTVVVEPRRGGDRGAMPDLPKFTIPDFEGKFVAGGLRPGKYRLRAVRSIRTLTSAGGLIGYVMRARLVREDATADVEVEPGKTTFVELEAIREPDQVEGPAARVAGTVLLNGRPGKDLLVSVRGRRRHGVTVDAAGRFDLGPLPVGTTRLTVRDPARADVIDMRMESHLYGATVEVSEGRDLELDIHIETGALRGFVTSGAGEAVSAVRVKATGRVAAGEGRPERTATALVLSDQRGAFAFDHLPAGTYRVEVQDRERGYGRSETIEVTPRGLVGGVSIRLGRTFTVGGHLDVKKLAEPRPRWCFVLLEGADGARQQGGRVRGDGTFVVRGMPSGTFRAKVVFGGDGGERHERAATEQIVITDRDLQGIELSVARQDPVTPGAGLRPPGK